MKKIYCIIICCLFINCNNVQNCDKSYVSKYLIDYSNERDYSYCELIDKSLDNNVNSIREFSLLNFSDGMTYEHGVVILEIINKVGENQFLKAIDNISVTEKMKIKAYLDAGFDLSENPRFENKSLKSSLQEIFNYLSN